MRIHIHAFLRFRDFHRFEHAQRFGARRRFAHSLVLHQHFGQLCAHFHIRVERSHRVLKNHRNFAGADSVQTAFAQIEDFPAIKAHRALRAPVFRQQAHNGKGRLRFARARFAHDAQRFTLLQSEVQLVYSGDVALFRVEGHLQILYV